MLVALWLLVALTPTVVGELRREATRSLSPPVRAMESVIDRQLYGDLFQDLGTLRSTLPDQVAVEQFLGDFHARLGQWEIARQRYEAVLDEEPENVSALIDLGAYYFNRGDYGNAVARFQEALSIEPESAAAYFNLNRAYNESYLYDEGREALLEARRIDDLQVTEWMDLPEDEHIVTAKGGFARRAEIEEALDEVWSSPGETPTGGEVFQRVRSVPMVGGLLVGGFVLLLVMRRLGGGAVAGGSFQTRSATRREGVSWRRFVPGLVSASQGRGIRAFLAVLLPASLLAVIAVAVGRGFGYPVPWRYDPGDWLLLSVAIVGLVAIVALRTFGALRSRS